MEKGKKQKKEEIEEEEEVEEVEEVEEEEDRMGEDFGKDPRAFPLIVDAGRIADAALDYAIELVKPNASIYEICVNTDNFVRQELAKVYTKKKYTKGLAFPTCVSVNEVCGLYSPTAEDLDVNHKTLVQGDVVKVDLGVHIHGFATVVAHTVVCGEDKVSGRKADVILAAYNALHASLRLMNVGKNTNDDVTNIVKKVTDSYKTQPLEAVLSHNMKKDIIDSFETILLKKTNDQKVDIRKFEHGNLFGLDVFVSTGEGKTKEADLKVTVYKRALETTYKLKTESARKLLSVVEHNFFNFPFSLNAFDNEQNLKTTKQIDNLKNVQKMGLSECVNHDLFYPNPVMVEKKGEIVAHFKYTIAVRNEGPLVVCGKLLDTSKFSSECTIEDEEVKALLAKNLDDYVPNSKKTVKVEKKKDNKEKKAKKREAKAKKAEEEGK